jgi:hypothetical protein
VLEKLPLFLIVGASAGATLENQTVARVDFGTLPLSARLANAATSYVDYLTDMIFPANLGIYYPHPGPQISPTKVTLCTAVLLGITGAVVAYRRRFPYLAVGWFWYLGMLVPVIGIVQVGSQGRADRYTYLPQIGIDISVVWGCAELARRAALPRPPLVAVSVLVLGALTVTCWFQIDHWRDNYALFARASEVSGRHWIIDAQVGTELAKLGRYEEALPHLRVAYKDQRPGKDRELSRGILFLVLTKSGEELARQRKAEESLQRFGEAYELFPDAPSARRNLADASTEVAILLARQRRVRDALPYFAAAVELTPDSGPARTNLGGALVSVGRAEEAIPHLQQALKIDPNDQRAKAALETARSKIKP